MAVPLASTIEPPTSTSSSAPLTAVVKGAGPSGLAAAIALAQTGFNVDVIEKRPSRPPGDGRKNMTAIRPEGLHQLHKLGALHYAMYPPTPTSGNVGNLTRITEGNTYNEFTEFLFPWPLTRYPPAEPSEYREGKLEEYRSAKITEQVPSSFINLGDLEDCLAQAAKALGVKITYDATLSLSRQAGIDSYAATLVSNDGSTTNLGRPDLIVCASGKNDHSLQSELGFTHQKGIILSEGNLPDPKNEANPFCLRLDDSTEELESQRMSVFGVTDPSVQNGILDHVVRKHPHPKSQSVSSTSSPPSSNSASSSPPPQPSTPSSEPTQPLIEIQMTHSQTAHLILQPPRHLSSPHAQHDLESYLLSVLNRRISPQNAYTSLSELQSSGAITWGSPLDLITVETSTAPRYVFGQNVVLVGDCAVSCSPSSGLGCEIGITVDSQSVRTLGEKIVAARDSASNAQATLQREALIEYNLRKAESAVLWSQASRMFYWTKEEAKAWTNNGEGEAKLGQVDV